MKFTISRDSFLKALQQVIGVVERKQTLPILSNVLIKAEEGKLYLTGTDLEVEIVSQVAADQISSPGGITVPGRKLLDITRSLNEGQTLQFELKAGKALLSCGKSRFTLTTLPANEFPNVDDAGSKLSFSIPQAELKVLIDDASFAMAQQDVRYYLNGMLLEAADGKLRTVATDGHRLAMSTRELAGVNSTEKVQVILPRKGVMELSRLLDADGPEAEVSIGANHFRILTGGCHFTTKLVDGNYPDYERVLPRGGNNILEGEREVLKQAFNRAAILSNEKYRGVRLQLSDSQLKLIASNPEQEQAEEELGVSYSGDSFEVGFNVSYILDVLNVLSGKLARFTLSDANSSALVEDPSNPNACYVIMPMRL